MTTTHNAVGWTPAAITEGEVPEVKADLQLLSKAEAGSSAIVTALSVYSTITDKAHAEEALAVAKDASKISKAIEERRKLLVGPYNNTVKEINDHAKRLIGQIDDSIAAVKAAVLRWQKAEEERLRLAKIEARANQLLELGFVKEGDVYQLAGVATVAERELSAHIDAMWADMLKHFAVAKHQLAKQQLQALEEQSDLTEAFGTDEDKQALENEKAAVEGAASAVPEVPVHFEAPSAAPLKGTIKRWVFEVQDASLVPREFLVVNETAIRKAVADGARSIPGVRIYQDESISLR